MARRHWSKPEAAKLTSAFAGNLALAQLAVEIRAQQNSVVLAPGEVAMKLGSRPDIALVHHEAGRQVAQSVSKGEEQLDSAVGLE